MDENHIREYISLLEQDKQGLLNQIIEIDRMIDRHKAQLLQLQMKKRETTPSLFPYPAESSNTGSVLESRNAPIVNIDPNFPSDEGIDDQIIYLFEKEGRAIRLPDLQEKFNTAHGGKGRNITNVARRMKAETKLVAAKFNNANTLTFWGLPEWVEKDEQGKMTFIEENRPSRKDLPSGYNTIEFLN